ncbi:MAG: hypothetical protein ABGX40_05645 [Methylococcales bacterium]|jgi:hypothetical protein|nr:hypothetical protein [Methylococcaceae bacterium]
MGLFDRFKEKQVAVRQLDHPRDLLVGDMVDFALMNQPGLSHKSFQVTQIWTLDLGGDKQQRIYFQLEDGEATIRLRVVDQDTVELGLEVYPEILLAFFSEADIAGILDADSGVNHHLKARVSVQDAPQELVGWVAEKYRQEGFNLAYRYDQDYRDRSLPEYMDGSEEGCDFAWLFSDDRQHALEFRVFDGGRTEAHLCAYIPLRKIDALWPAKQT